MARVSANCTNTSTRAFAYGVWAASETRFASGQSRTQVILVLGLRKF